MSSPKSSGLFFSGGSVRAGWAVNAWRGKAPLISAFSASARSGRYATGAAGGSPRHDRATGHDEGYFLRYVLTRDDDQRGRRKGASHGKPGGHGGILVLFRGASSHD